MLLIPKKKIVGGGGGGGGETMHFLKIAIHCHLFKHFLKLLLPNYL